MKKMTIVYSFWYSSFFKNARCNFMTCFLRLWPMPVDHGQKVMSFLASTVVGVCDDQIGLGYNLVGTVIAALRMGLHSSAITFERGTDGCLAHMSRYTVCSIMA